MMNRALKAYTREIHQISEITSTASNEAFISLSNGNLTRYDFFFFKLPGYHTRIIIVILLLVLKCNIIEEMNYYILRIQIKLSSPVVVVVLSLGNLSDPIRLFKF